MHDTSKMKEDNLDSKVTLSTAAVIRLGTGLTLAAPKTCSTREPTLKRKTKCTLFYAKGHSDQAE
jgi:hypothetical protein